MPIVQTQWFTWPHAVSFSRVFLAMMVAYLAGDNGYAKICLLLIALACVTDVLDGALARYLDQQTGLGCMIDPVCDAFFLIWVYSALVFYGAVPWPFFMLVFIRYFLLMLVHFYLYHLGYTRLGALWSGKVCAFCCVCFLVMVFVHKAYPLLLSASVLSLVLGVVQAVLLLSFAEYMWRYFRLLREYSRD